MGGTSPTVWIIDNHRVFQECLCSALSSLEKYPVRVVLEDVETLLETILEKLKKSRANVLLVNINITRERVLRLLSTVSSGESGDAKVLVLGSNQLEAIDYIEAGANGYIPKEESLGFLRSAISRVLHGEIVIPSQMIPDVFSRLKELSKEQLHVEHLKSSISRRQFEILQLIAEGMSNKEIAFRLHLSLYTVKNHVHNILEKLGVESRVKAVDHARAMGWLL